jgi:hypothetical protein
MPPMLNICMGWVIETVTVTWLPFTVTVPPGRGEVVLGVSGGLGGVEGDLAGGPVGGDVDGLRAGTCGGLGLVDGLNLGGERQPAVEDESGHQQQRQGEDDDEGGDHAFLLACPGTQSPEGGSHVALR